MSARSFDGSEAVPFAFDTGSLGRLTWLGLVVAGTGWALLIGTTLLAGWPAVGGNRAAAHSLHADLVDMAKCLIESGFALAIIGALQAGFGALNSFFSAVLNRSAPRTAGASAATSSVDRPLAPQRERRPYKILADGSVEVETIVGTRRFETMYEAREFI